MGNKYTGNKYPYVPKQGIPLGQQVLSKRLLFEPPRRQDALSAVQSAARTTCIARAPFPTIPLASLSLFSVPPTSIPAVRSAMDKQSTSNTNTKDANPNL